MRGRLGTVVRTLAAGIGLLAAAGLFVGIVVLGERDDDRLRAEFKDDCRDQGGRVVDLPSTDPLCRLGKLTIRFGEQW